eukprot:TRINITY_DN3197_c0_g1::TRINITY_DN3197_c0_g1_i1::g.3590::m.3590 TRINITY_DN3197_c0_g1::TRINITY_DN3197_c0_g1_i1::g.3590  ORF type:complete len:556 (-),score=106.59,sp/O94707/RXT3_SCHPO/30.19/1e-09,Rxt3/PF08642.5/2e-11,Rxt3/PF08642.5/66 TRINITY_DN3197_c0_g1_i1:474-2060(-)
MSESVKRKKGEDVGKSSRPNRGANDERPTKRAAYENEKDARRVLTPGRCKVQAGRPQHPQMMTVLAELDPSDPDTPVYSISWRAGNGNPFIYVPGAVLPDMYPKLLSDHKCSIEIRIESRYLTAYNPHAKARHVWGTDTYTDDSDLVAVLQHAGYFFLSPNIPPYAALLVYVRGILPPRRFIGRTRNLITSRTWKGGYENRAAYQVIKVFAVNAVGDMTQLKPKTMVPSIHSSYPGKPDIQSSGRQYIPDVTLAFNLSSDPCLTYALSHVVDSGTEPIKYTSTRLLQDCLYIETAHDRYEISCPTPPEDLLTLLKTLGPYGTLPKTDGAADPLPTHPLRLRFAKVKDPVLLDITALSRLSLPLDTTHVTPIHDDLDWEELTWLWDGVRIRGKSYRLYRLMWVPVPTRMGPTPPVTASASSRAGTNTPPTASTPTTTLPGGASSGDQAANNTTNSSSSSDSTTAASASTAANSTTESNVGAASAPSGAGAGNGGNAGKNHGANMLSAAAAAAAAADAADEGGRSSHDTA